MIVVDASVVAEALVHPDSAELKVLLTGDASAPGHLDAEVLSVFRGLVRGGYLKAVDLPAYAEALAAAPIERLEAAQLLSTAVTMFDNLSAYDALYVAAALHHDARLATRDRGMGDTARRLGVPLVELR